jgi:DNA-directed RNA polymerase specialized sigma subunit
MKDLRVEIRVKNNPLYSAIMAQYDSVAHFCRENDLTTMTVGGYINFKISPLTKRETPNESVEKGSYIKQTASQIIDALGVGFLEVFPTVSHESKESKFVAEMDSQDFLPYDDSQYISLLDEPKPHRDFSKLDDVLNTIPERNRKILKERFGLGCQKKTLRQIAGEQGISCEGVRQIERRGLWLLRNPTRVRHLKDLMEYTP